MQASLKRIAFYRDYDINMVAQPAIELLNLTKKYGRDRGIEAISFSVAHGQVFGFLGPNGSGKSTAMRLLMGLLEPTSGSATILGRDSLSHDSKLLSRVGYLPGSLSLYKNMTGRDFLRYVSKLRKGNFDKEIEVLADRLHLDLKKHIHDLSKGNRQKVGVVQAFMHSPDVLILDEPTSGLDPLIQREFQVMLQEVKARGAAVLLSSHVLSEVENLADQIAVISEGRIVLNESIATLKSKHAHTIVLTFPSPIDLSKYRDISTVISSAGNRLICKITGAESALLKQAVVDGVITVETNEASLDSIFLELIDKGSRT